MWGGGEKGGEGGDIEVERMPEGYMSIKGLSLGHSFMDARVRFVLFSLTTPLDG